MDKIATPPTRTAPGGDFTFNVLVTNNSTEVLTITSLTDDVYGDITTRANSTCTTAIGTVLQPAPAPATPIRAPSPLRSPGWPGDSQTDIVTVRATNPGGTEVTDDDDAVVSLTAVPTIAVDKTATPLVRTAPGGDFTFNVVVTNTVDRGPHHHVAHRRRLRRPHHQGQLHLQHRHRHRPAAEPRTWQLLFLRLHRAVQRGGR